MEIYFKIIKFILKKKKKKEKFLVYSSHFYVFLNLI